MNFEQWYSDLAKKHDYNPNPKDWEHYYDYESAFNAGIREPELNEEGRYKWPSEFKHDFHPDRFIDQGDGSFLDSKHGNYVDKSFVSEIRMQADDYRKEKAMESLLKGEDRFPSRVSSKVL